MIKRTPQEVADFFGCYVGNLRPYLWSLFKKRPSYNKDFEWWETKEPDQELSISSELIYVPENCDYSILYEPREQINLKKEGNND